MKRDILVSVCMSTYNHEEYIEEALNSVLEQECDFEYEIILSNDQSSDNTHAVITKYIENHPKGNKVRYYNQPKNLGINDNLIFTLEQAKGKYIALLEGDDYWTDSKKLQKQYVFLENNSDYTICTAAYATDIPGEGYRIIKHEEEVDGVTYTFNKLVGIRSHYLNMFFVRKALEIDRLKTFSYSGDNVIFIMCLANGKGYFFNQVFGYRREHPNGAWSSKSLIERLKMSIEQFIGLYKFTEYKNAVRPILFYYYADLIGFGDKQKSYGYNAFKMIRTWKEFLYFIKKIGNSLYQSNK
mgnify:CR=1 FL=1